MPCLLACSLACLRACLLACIHACMCAFPLNRYAFLSVCWMCLIAPCLCLIPYTSCGDLVLCRWFPFSMASLPFPPPRPSNTRLLHPSFSVSTPLALLLLFLSFFSPTLPNSLPPSPSSWLSRCLLSPFLLFLFLFPSSPPPPLFFISLLSFFRLILFKRDVKYCQIMLLIFFSAAYNAEGVEAARQQRKNEGSPAKLLQPLQNASTNTLMLVLQPLQQLCQGPKEREPGGVGNFFWIRTNLYILVATICNGCECSDTEEKKFPTWKEYENPRRKVRRHHASSTAQSGGGSFKDRQAIGRVGWLLWLTDGRANPSDWTERWLELCFSWGGCNGCSGHPHQRLLDVAWCSAVAVVVIGVVVVVA